MNILFSSHEDFRKLTIAVPSELASFVTPARQ